MNFRHHLETVRAIPPPGLLLEPISILFGNHGFQSGDLEVEVEGGEGVMGFDLLESSDRQTIVGFSPSMDEDHTELYSAQFETGPDISTSLKLAITGD